MSERRTIQPGILVVVVFIVILDVLFFYVQGISLMDGSSNLITVSSFSTESIMMLIDVFLVILSLIIIPYGFITRKNWARIYAMLFLVWSLFRSIVYISMTGEKIIGFLLFALCVIFIIYLLMSSVKRFFGKIPMDAVPSEETKEFTYGLYTLYSELVRLKNGKTQLIYFFSKQKPKSGTPASFPDGFEVEVSKRSGLPYLKKRETSSTMF
jgi:hypothetical protein